MEIIIENFTFTPNTRRIELDDYTNVEIEEVIRIVNVTRRELLYVPGTRGYGGAIVPGGDNNVIELESDTSQMASTDKLQIFYFDRTASELSKDTNSSITGLGHGKKTVTSAGTEVALALSTVAKKVLIQAYRANTGNIAVGATGVDATNTTGDGIQLAAGESVLIPCDNLADVFIDATVNGEGVRYTYFT